MSVSGLIYHCSRWTVIFITFVTQREHYIRRHFNILEVFSDIRNDILI